MKWNPENTPPAILSVVLIGLGLTPFFLPIESSRPIASTISLLQLTVGMILIGASIILLIVKWRR